jgi:ribonucleoside-diphosphate reductase alpha chain
LAKTRGVFPNYSSSPWKQTGRKVRHRTLTAVCPAPTLAALAGVTPGVGPLDSIFQWEPGRNEAKLTPIELLRRIASQKKLWTKGLEEELQNGGSTGWDNPLPPELRELFATAKEIPDLALARIQGAVERAGDGAVGVCFDPAPDFFSISEFLAEIFPLGLKQIHLAQNLRPRLVSLRQEIPTAELPSPVEETEESTPSLAEESVADEMEESFSPAVPRPMPEVLEARTRGVRTFHGEMKVTLGFDRHGPLELSARVGKAGSEAAAQAEALSRLISLLLQVGVDPQNIIEELKDLRCFSPVRTGEGTSLPDAVAQVLSLEFPEEPTEVEPLPETCKEEEITELSEAGTLH